MANHVVFISDDRPASYLIGEDGSVLVRVFNPHNGTIGEPLPLASIRGHTVGTEWLDYEGSPEEEQAILGKAQAALTAVEQRRQEYLARKQKP